MTGGKRKKRLHQKRYSQKIIGNSISVITELRLCFLLIQG